MKNPERIVAMVGASIADAAERIAGQMENNRSGISGPQALRNFARAIRDANGDIVTDDTAIH